MADELLLIDGSSFCLSDGRGDVGGEGTAGLFAADVRHLSEWRLLLDDAPLRLLTSRLIDRSRARIFGTASGEVKGSPVITVIRTRSIGDGFKETFSFVNHSHVEQRFRTKLMFACDFADIFEIRAKDAPGAPGATSKVIRDGDTVTLRYTKGSFARATILTFGLPFTLAEEGRCATFDLVLPPRSTRELSVVITCVLDESQAVSGPLGGKGGGGKGGGGRRTGTDAFLEQAPKLSTDSELLLRTYGQSLEDLAALRFAPTEDPGLVVPAAGLPWFMALFGRDSLITAYQALPFAPDLARSTLITLARFQATNHDDWRDAEPGKILHELRRGKLAALGEIPHTPYYGTHDATPLFLILLEEFERWSGDSELVRGLKEPALRAIEWLDGDGDKDGDGYLEYSMRSSRGLPNQCWKDSWDSIVDRRGRLAAAPIATCEIQGYAYDAKRRAARLCRDLWDEGALAERLEDSARRLKGNFNRDFYNEAIGTYVLALDASKRQIDSVASNIGHLLWSGIVEATRAPAIADRLIGSDMFNGWGVRTLSADEVAYNPVGYHTGTVWPHDTGLIAEGMRRYGFRNHASKLLCGLFESAAFFGHRLPEVFAGLAREDTEIPVEYPAASSPQAWAAGAPLLALRTWLGMDPGATLAYDPALPRDFGAVRLDGVHLRGKLVNTP